MAISGGISTAITRQYYITSRSTGLVPAGQFESGTTPTVLLQVTSRRRLPEPQGREQPDWQTRWHTVTSQPTWQASDRARERTAVERWGTLNRLKCSANITYPGSSLPRVCASSGVARLSSGRLGEVGV